MASSTGVNKLSIVNQDSGGVSTAFPDVCKTPMSGGPVPIPYSNVALSADTTQGSVSVRAGGVPFCLKSSSFSTSTGDEPGSVGGVVSGTTKGKAEFINASFDVKVEGRGVARALDLMVHNNRNTPPFPVLQGPVTSGGKGPTEQRCLCCNAPLSGGR